MKIVLTASGASPDSPIDPRFGRTAYLALFDDETGVYSFSDNREVDAVAHGAGPHTARKLAQLGAEVLVTGNGPGGNAGSALEQMGVRVVTGAGGMTVREAVAAFRNGALA